MSIITHLPTQSVLRRRQFESAGTHMLIYWPLMQIRISNVNERVSAGSARSLLSAALSLKT